MPWVRSLNQSLSAYEVGPRKVRRYTWHLLARGRRNEAYCNIRYPVSDVVADQPPEGARVCMNCFTLAERRKETA